MVKDPQSLKKELESCLHTYLPDPTTQPMSAEEKHEYLTNTRLQLLKLKYEDKAIGGEMIDTLIEIEERENELQKYDIFYAQRMVKQQKKYHQYSQFKAKQRQMEEQKAQEQQEIIDQFFSDLTKRIKLKDRDTDAKDKELKRKYYR